MAGMHSHLNLVYVILIPSHWIIVNCQTQTKLNYEDVHHQVSCTFPISNIICVSNLSHSGMEEAPGANAQAESDGLIQVVDTNNEEVQSLPLKERIRQKIATVRWKALVTTAIIVVDLFLLYASISLIGVFFSAEVSGGYIAMCT